MLESSLKTSTKKRAKNDRIDELDRRMRRPQRHRLLQGYPMAPVMQPVTPDEVPRPEPSDRPVIVGVLPHPFCNPAVRGCGFCTFPHQKFHRSVSDEVVHAVQREIDHRVGELEWLRRAKIPAVYVGGGTANLVTPSNMSALYDKLASTFDLAGAEISLEGAPRYFTTRNNAHLDLLAGLDVDHRRISMGVQTFDYRWLEKMGRLAIGAPEHVDAAVREAQARGITTSCDLLYNLPGQTLGEMLADIDRAASLGFDQICVYHLVLYQGLGTEWSKDASLVGSTPDMPEACRNWLAVRKHLLDLGYAQSTLTNFERADVPESRRFRYERLSFQPESTDGIGFGPAGLTTFASSSVPWKTMNHTDAASYLDAVTGSGSGVARGFSYGYFDRQLLNATRQLPLMRILRRSPDARWTFRQELEALKLRGLVKVTRNEIRLTPVGMFYADSIAGLLADRRIRQLRTPPDLNAAHAHHMG